MKSFTEESNCLSLVICPHASLTDSLQQYMNVSISAEVIILHEQEPLVSLISWSLCLLSQVSFIDCVCSLCGGPQASETLKFLSLPRHDSLLISYWSGEQPIMSCSVTSDHVSAGSWSFWCSALTSRPPWSSWRIDWRFLRSWRCAYFLFFGLWSSTERTKQPVIICMYKVLHLDIYLGNIKDYNFCQSLFWVRAPPKKNVHLKWPFLHYY